jgi:hypothetical protein
VSSLSPSNGYMFSAEQRVKLARCMDLKSGVLTNRIAALQVKRRDSYRVALSYRAADFAQKRGNTIEEVTEGFPLFYTMIDEWALPPSALMGEGIAWFAWRHGRNRSARSPWEHSQSVPVRANRARKPSQPGAFRYLLAVQKVQEKNQQGRLCCVRHISKICHWQHLILPKNRATPFER